MRRHAFATAAQVSEGILVACALATFGACSEPGAMTDEPGAEVLVPHASIQSSSASLQRFLIREVRLGHGIDVDGKVPPSLSADKFMAGDPIKLSMWVAAAPAGSLIRADALDVTGRTAWSQDAEAPGNGSYLEFDLGRQLASGKYRIDVTIDHELASRTSFEIIDRGDWDRR
jgi:hypothetical protein